MTTQITPQHPIGSGFGPRSTADDVLAGLDISGRLAVVTGGYSGIGLETSRALARAGARVIVPARRPVAACQALAEVRGVEVDELDLADLGSVRDFADRFLASGRSIDIMINGAGIMACPETRVGPGWEAQFAVNHLGHFALVNRLWPALAAGAGARVVAVSSGYQISAIHWDDLQFERHYDKWQAYIQAKTANVLFAIELDRLGSTAAVRAFSLNPGAVLTPLQRHLARTEMVEAGWTDAEGNGINPDFKTTAQGAATQVWAATSPQLAGLGGVYLQDCDLDEPPADAARAGEFTSYAEQARRLWALSGELTGVDAFATGVPGPPDRAY